MVTRWDEYRECLDSFRERGFDESCSEYLVLDNSRENLADGYVAINEFLQAARGDYVLIFHQDVLLLDHGRVQLEASIAALDVADPHWAVCGNAGHGADGWPAVSITHRLKGADVRGGPFPAPVVSVDENFILVRRLANLAVSRDLTGFHHYGPDLCTMAGVLGWNCYVIDFMLLHKSEGNFDASYWRSHRAIALKYRRAFRPRWVHLITDVPFHVAGSGARTFAARVVRKVKRHLGLLPRHRDPRERARRERRAQAGIAPR